MVEDPLPVIRSLVGPPNPDLSDLAEPAQQADHTDSRSRERSCRWEDTSENVIVRSASTCSMKSTATALAARCRAEPNGPKQTAELPTTNKSPRPLWFAMWNIRHNRSHALDAYPDELVPLQGELKTTQQRGGDRFAGPFPSRHQAERFAAARLNAARAQR
jgi:hypothetical protein